MSAAVAMGSAVLSARGELLAQAWVDSASRWWATGYDGRKVVRVPTSGPHASREIALQAVGVKVDAAGKGRRA